MEQQSIAEIAVREAVGRAVGETWGISSSLRIQDAIVDALCRVKWALPTFAEECAMNHAVDTEGEG